VSIKIQVGVLPRSRCDLPSDIRCGSDVRLVFVTVWYDFLRLSYLSFARSYARFILHCSFGLQLQGANALSWTNASFIVLPSGKAWSGLYITNSIKSGPYCGLQQRITRVSKESPLPLPYGNAWKFFKPPIWFSNVRPILSRDKKSHGCIRSKWIESEHSWICLQWRVKSPWECSSSVAELLTRARISSIDGSDSFIRSFTISLIMSNRFVSFCKIWLKVAREIPRKVASVFCTNVWNQNFPFFSKIQNLV